MLRSYCKVTAIFVLLGCNCTCAGLSKAKTGFGGNTTDESNGGRDILPNFEAIAQDLCGKPRTINLKGNIAGVTIDRTEKNDRSSATNFSSSNFRFNPQKGDIDISFTFPGRYDESLPFFKKVAANIELQGNDPINVGNCLTNDSPSHLSVDVTSETYIFDAKDLRKNPYCNNQPIGGIQGCIRDRRIIGVS